MKKLALNLIVFIFLFCYYGCSKKEDKNQNLNYKRVFNINSKILITSDKLLDPTIIESLDTLIILSNYKANPLVEIYGLSGKLLMKTIDIGKGPNEILATGRIQIDYDNRNFYVNDLFAKKVIKCSIDGLLNNKSYSPITVFNNIGNDDTQNVHFDKILVISDSSFVGENRSPAGRLMFMDKTGNSLGYYLTVPEKENVNQKLTEFANASLYASAVTINPSRTKIAFATYSAGMIDLFDINTKSLIYSINEFYPTGIVATPMGENIVPVHTEDSKTGYLDIAATDEFVFALFSGRTMKNENYSYGNIIKVISWKGDVNFELNLNQDIKRLSVSLDNKKIFGISKNKNEEPEILVFDISSIIDKI